MAVGRTGSPTCSSFPSTLNNIKCVLLRKAVLSAILLLHTIIYCNYGVLLSFGPSARASESSQDNLNDIDTHDVSDDSKNSRSVGSYSKKSRLKKRDWGMNDPTRRRVLFELSLVSHYRPRETNTSASHIDISSPTSQQPWDTSTSCVYHNPPPSSPTDSSSTYTYWSYRLCFHLDNGNGKFDDITFTQFHLEPSDSILKFSKENTFRFDDVDKTVPMSAENGETYLITKKNDIGKLLNSKKHVLKQYKFTSLKFQSMLKSLKHKRHMENGTKNDEILQNPQHRLVSQLLAFINNEIASKFTTGTTNLNVNLKERSGNIDIDKVYYLIQGQSCQKHSGKTFTESKRRRSVAIVMHSQCCNHSNFRHHNHHDSEMHNLFGEGPTKKVYIITEVKEIYLCNYIAGVCKICNESSQRDEIVDENIETMQTNQSENNSTRNKKSENDISSNESNTYFENLSLLDLYLHRPNKRLINPLSKSAPSSIRPYIKYLHTDKSYPPFPQSRVESNLKLIKHMFTRSYDAYMYNAYPASELKPISCQPSKFDLARIPALTLIDTLDTLVVLGNWTEFARAVERLRNLDIDAKSKDGMTLPRGNDGAPRSDQGIFAINQNVSVFETNIRVLGGLLSAHQMAIAFLSSKVKVENIFDSDGYVKIGNYNEDIAIDAKTHVEDGEYWEYDDILLSLALDIGIRLLPAFNTQTGIPYGTVNLLKGVPPKETAIASLAGGGTLTIEMELLSRLTGDMRFGKAAKLATRALWNRRSKLDLLGKHLDVQSGKWVENLSGIGSNSDSFYEYLLKYSVLHPNLENDGKTKNCNTNITSDKTGFAKVATTDDFWIMFLNVYLAIRKESRTGQWYPDVDMHKGLYRNGIFVFESLQAFFPGMQVLLGDLRPGFDSLNSFLLVREYLGFLPERFDYGNWKVDDSNYSGGGLHPLRPELLESIYFAHLASLGFGGEKKRHSFLSSWMYAADFALHTLEHTTKTRCGYSGVKSVSPETTGKIGQHIFEHTSYENDSSYFGNSTNTAETYPSNNELHNEMPSYFLSETLKYLYLTFDATNLLHKDYQRDWIFTTEAHPVHYVSFLHPRDKKAEMNEVDMNNKNKKSTETKPSSAYRIDVAVRDNILNLLRNKLKDESTLETGSIINQTSILKKSNKLDNQTRLKKWLEKSSYSISQSETVKGDDDENTFIDEKWTSAISRLMYIKDLSKVNDSLNTASKSSHNSNRTESSFSDYNTPKSSKDPKYSLGKKVKAHFDLIMPHSSSYDDLLGKETSEPNYATIIADTNSNVSVRRHIPRQSCPNRYHSSNLWVQAIHGTGLEYEDSYMSSAINDEDDFVKIFDWQYDFNILSKNIVDESERNRFDSRLLTSTASSALYGSGYFSSIKKDIFDYESVNPNIVGASRNLSSFQDVKYDRKIPSEVQKYTFGTQTYEISVFEEGFWVRNVHSGEVIEANIFSSESGGSILSTLSRGEKIILIQAFSPTFATSRDSTRTKLSNEKMLLPFEPGRIHFDGSHANNRRKKVFSEGKPYDRVVVSDTNKHSYFCEVILYLDDDSSDQSILNDENFIAKYPCAPATFGPTSPKTFASMEDIEADAILLPPNPSNVYGCSSDTDFDHDGNLSISMVLRGDCNFSTKAANAVRSRNAVAMIVVNSDLNQNLFVMAPGKIMDKNEDESISSIPISVLVTKEIGGQIFKLRDEIESENIGFVRAKVRLRAQKTRTLKEVNAPLHHSPDFPLVNASVGKIDIIAPTGWTIQARQSNIVDWKIYITNG